MLLHAHHTFYNNKIYENKVDLCWVVFMIYDPLAYFSHMETWKQDKPNLWNRSGDIQATSLFISSSLVS